MSTWSAFWPPSATRRNSLVPNLEQKDFTILEDGKPQPIKYFTRETDLPLTIGLLIDVSGSQRNLIQIERDAASQFFTQVLRKKDEAFLLSFGEEAELLQDYTNSPRLLTNGDARSAREFRRGRLRAGSGSYHRTAARHGALRRGVPGGHEKLKSEVGRKVIVVITDGVDEGSRLPIGSSDGSAEGRRGDLQHRV
jgi:VWFA-related protein